MNSPDAWRRSSRSIFGPRVSGYITEIHFEAGAIIKKGDLLYVIDPRPYQADFDRAAAEFERMQAQLKLGADRVGSGEGSAGQEYDLGE